MKKRLLHMLLPVLTLVLELLPWGAVLVFANPEGENWRRTYSYFDLLPFGYANFTPLITGILTCVLTVILTLYWITGKPRAAKFARNLLFACVPISFGQLVLGFFSWVSLLISVLLLLEWILLTLDRRKQEPRL